MCGVISTFDSTSQVTVGTGSATTIGIPFDRLNAFGVTLQSLTCPRLSIVRERRS